jgi:hypothetical protein
MPSSSALKTILIKSSGKQFYCGSNRFGGIYYYNIKAIFMLFYILNTISNQYRALGSSKEQERPGKKPGQPGPPVINLYQYTFFNMRVAHYFTQSASVSPADN